MMVIKRAQAFRTGTDLSAAQCLWRDMSFDHVIPQFAMRLKRTVGAHARGALTFPIQGSGEETRNYCHVQDLVQGVMTIRKKGGHLNIQHIGTADGRKGHRCAARGAQSALAAHAGLLCPPMYL
jgi:nucleoside-diphosphate-sugar epimerase